VGVSSDGGESWTPASVGLQYGRCLATDGSTVLVGGGFTTNILYQTSDCITWTAITAIEAYLKIVNEIVMSDANNWLLVGTKLDDSVSIFRTTDAGATYTDLGLPGGLTNVDSMILAGVDVVIGGNIFSSPTSTTVVATSSNFGTSWTMRTLQALTEVKGLAQSDITGTIIATGYFNVEYSNDGGATWTAVAIDAGAPGYGAAYGNGVFLVLGDGAATICRSDDDGVSWTNIANPVGEARSAFYNAGRWVMGGFDTNGYESIAYSTDDAATFSNLTGNLNQLIPLGATGANGAELWFNNAPILGQTGPAGPEGPAGPQGEQGPAGSSPMGLQANGAILSGNSAEFNTTDDAVFSIPFPNKGVSLFAQVSTPDRLLDGTGEEFKLGTGQVYLNLTGTDTAQLYIGFGNAVGAPFTWAESIPFAVVYDGNNTVKAYYDNVVIGQGGYGWTQDNIDLYATVLNSFLNVGPITIYPTGLGITGATGAQGIPGTAVNTGATGPQGTPGSSTAFFPYNASTNTSPPPATTQIRWNNATQINSTELYINMTDVGGTDVDLFLANLRQGDSFIIQSQALSDDFQKWLITGTPVFTTNYWTLPVSLITSGGDDQFSGGQNIILVLFGLTGPTGATGSTGMTGATGPTGPGVPNFLTVSTLTVFNGQERNLWVAVGEDAGGAIGSIKVSTDGRNWTNNASGGFSVAGRGVAFNGSNRWVAVGEDASSANTIQVSTDGSNWTPAASGGFTSSINIGTAVAWCTDRFVAGGADVNRNSTIQYSTDGSNFIAVPSGGFAYSSAASNGSYVNNIQTNGFNIGVFGWGGNNNSTVQYSLDGSNFIGLSNLGGVGSFAGGPLTKAFYQQGRYTCVGSNSGNFNFRPGQNLAGPFLNSNSGGSALNTVGTNSTITFMATDGQTSWLGMFTSGPAAGRVRVANNQIGYNYNFAPSGDQFSVAPYGAGTGVIGSVCIVGEDATPNGTIKYLDPTYLGLSNALSGGFSTRGYDVCYSLTNKPDATIDGTDFFSLNNQQSSNHQIMGATTSNLVIDQTLFVDRIRSRLGVGVPAPTQSLDVNGAINVSGSVISPQFTNTVLGSSNAFFGNIWMNTTTGYISSTGAVFARRGGFSTINVGVNTTANPAFDLLLQRDSAAKPLTNTWTITSDERVKNFITLADLDICYSTIKAIPLKHYEWAIPEFEANDKHSLGYIAQDVEKVFPKAVEKIEAHGFDDCRTLNTDQIIKMMHGALQKVMERVETLEKEVARLSSA
jgi:hypothetical protein